jgi:hypothetical protein
MSEGVLALELAQVLEWGLVWASELALEWGLVLESVLVLESA